jgi:nitrile hydratase
MDTVHDMGGMHGFGPVDVTDAGAFHEAWEKRVPGIRVAMRIAGRGGGELRSYIESIPAATYLSSRYYERWALGLSAIVVDSGLLREEDIAARVEELGSGAVEAPVTSQARADVHNDVAAKVRGATNPATDVPARFTVGDTVRVRRMAPRGHTRCPRYVRGLEGKVERVTGGFARPDPGDHPVEQTYTVAFDLHDIWGDDAEPGRLYLDLWEGYLE